MSFNKYILWFLPFIFFAAGYSLISYLISIQAIKAPLLIGQPLQNALKIASAHRVSLRISAEKDDAQVPEGMILSQSPLPGSTMKAQQALFVVVARKPAARCAPDVRGKREQEVDESVYAAGIRCKKYSVESYLPVGRCIGQFPAAGVALEEQEVLIVYLSAGGTPIRVMPDVRGWQLEDVRAFAQQYSLPLKIVGASDGVVIEQRPLPGSILTITRPLTLSIMLQNFVAAD